MSLTMGLKIIFVVEAASDQFGRKTHLNLHVESLNTSIPPTMIDCIG